MQTPWSAGCTPLCPNDTHTVARSPETASVSQLNRLEEASLAEGAWLHPLDTTTESVQVGTLVERAVRHDSADPAYLAELALWMRYDHDAQDGIPARARGSAPYPVDGLPQAGLATAGYLTKALADELACGSFLVLGTGGDTPADWVRAGMALERLLLEATTLGMVVSFANQVLELPDLRDALADTIGAEGYAQLLFRVGHPLAGVPATPRRNLADLFPYSGRRMDLSSA